MCLRLRRSIVAESASAVVIIGGSHGSQVFRGACSAAGLQGVVHLGLVAGEGEEDVVEVGGVQCQLGDVDAVIVEASEDCAQLRDGASGGDLERERFLVGLGGPPDDRL